MNTQNLKIVALTKQIQFVLLRDFSISYIH